MSLFKGLFKSFKSQLMGSVKADLNSALEGQRNLFNASISNALDDMFKAKFGVNISNIPSEIKSHAEQMSQKNAADRKLDTGQSDSFAGRPVKRKDFQFPTDEKVSAITNWVIFRTMQQVGASVANREGYEIFLPLPKLTDDIGVSYKTQEIGFMQAATQGLLDIDFKWGSFGDEGGKGFLDTIGDLAMTGGGELATKMKEQLAVLEPIASGEVQNPVKFQLFDNVGFRQHSYTFDLHPYNEADSLQISELIYALKIASLPTVKKENPRKFLIPYTFEIDYFGPVADQLEKPLPCGLTKVGVDYSGGHDVGYLQSADVDKAYPNGVQLSLEFTELMTMDTERYEKYVSTKRSDRMQNVFEGDRGLWNDSQIASDHKKFNNDGAYEKAVTQEGEQYQQEQERREKEMGTLERLATQDYDLGG